MGIGTMGEGVGMTTTTKKMKRRMTTMTMTKTRANDNRLGRGMTMTRGTMTRQCKTTRTTQYHPLPLHGDGHHHNSTPNHCREQLLMGWKQGAIGQGQRGAQETLLTYLGP